MSLKVGRLMPSRFFTRCFTLAIASSLVFGGLISVPRTGLAAPPKPKMAASPQPAPHKPTPQVQALLTRGRDDSDHDRIKESLATYDEAFTLANNLHDDTGAGASMIAKGMLLNYFGNVKEAFACFSLALHRFRRDGNRLWEAFALDRLGYVYNLLSEPDKALKSLTEALPIVRKLGKLELESSILTNLGETYSQTGDARRARQVFALAASAAHRSGKKQAEAWALYKVGYGDFYAGDLNAALIEFTQASQISKQIGDLTREAYCIAGIGYVYSRRGQDLKALPYFQQALTQSEQSRARPLSIELFGELAYTYLRLGNTDAAASDYKQETENAIAIGDTKSERKGLCGTADIACVFGDATEALAPYQRIIAICHEEKDGPGKASTLVRIGNAYLKLGDFTNGISFYQQALALARQMKDRQDEACTLYQIGLAYVAQKDYTRAEESLRASAAVPNTIQADPSDTDQFAFEPGQTEYIYLGMWRSDLLLHVLLTENKTTEALKRVQETHPDVFAFRRDQSSDQDLVSRVAKSLPSDTALLIWKQYELFLPKKTGDASEEYLVLLALTKDPATGRPQVMQYSSPFDPKALGLQISALRTACGNPQLPWQPDATSLYRTLISPAENQLIGKKRLIVCPDGAISNVPFAALVDSQNQTLLSRFEIDYNGSAAGMVIALQQGDTERKAIRKAVPATILVVANPRFGDAKRFLPRIQAQSEANDASPATDNTTAAAGGTTPLAKSADAVARERSAALVAALPETQLEAEAIRKDFGKRAKLLSGAAAQESTFTQAAPQYRYLHLATRGLHDGDSNFESALIFSAPAPGSIDNGLLTVGEIMGLDLSRCDMTVLPASESSGEGVDSGSSLAGLSAAFFNAGCPTEVISQWPVKDVSTATLMGLFYDRLLKNEPKGRALRESELALASDPHTAHPYYWAPFVLIGDWR